MDFSKKVGEKLDQGPKKNRYICLALKLKGAHNCPHGRQDTSCVFYGPLYFQSLKNDLKYLIESLHYKLGVVFETKLLEYPFNNYCSL